MAAAEVVLDAGYPESHGSFWMKVALTIVTALCTLFAQYTPGMAWPENRAFVTAAVAGFFMTQVLHLLLFIFREGVYFLETGPFRDTATAAASTLAATKQPGETGFSKGAGRSTGSSSAIGSSDGIALTSDWQRFSTTYKLKIMSNARKFAGGGKDERSVQVEIEMTDYFHADGYLSKDFKLLVAKKLKEFEALERKKKR